MSAEIQPWKTLSSSMVLDERWYKVRQDSVQLPDGTILNDYFVSVRPDVVVVIAVSSEGRVPLVRQYKHGADEITVEFPAGTFTDESPVDAARRELEEETGWSAEAFEEIGFFFDDASKNTNRVYTVVATKARASGEQKLEAVEFSAGVELLDVAVEDLKKLLDSGQIRAQSSAVSGYRFLSWRAETATA